MRTKIIASALALLLIGVFAALPVLAQRPPAPTNLSATATSASSMTITWTVIPTSGCTGDVDYYVRATNSNGHRVDNFTAVDANSQDFAGLQLGTYSINVWSYCWSDDDYSEEPATTSVTITSSTQQEPTVPDDSLGTANPSNLSATASGGVVTATWTSVAGQTAPSGYCDVTDYTVRLKASDGSDADYDEFITAGTWTSNTVTTSASYEVHVAAYSSECDDWSSWASYSIYVS